MSAESVRFMLYPGSEGGPSSATPSRQIQRLWFNLAGLKWSSLVLVPVDEGSSAAAVASSLADVGSRLRDSPVTAIVADAMDFESARILADLQLHVQDGRRSPAPAPEALAVEVAPQGPSADPAMGGGAEGRPPSSTPRTARQLAPRGQIVIAIQPVVVEPLGVAIAHAADAVVLCMKLRKTRLAAARRSIELIGSERVAGAILLP